jgi:hypothetical protein
MWGVVLDESYHDPTNGEQAKCDTTIPEIFKPLIDFQT